jgi:uracil permease
MKMEKKRDVVLDVHEMPKPGLLVGLSLQHLFAMFGATVLVPILVGIDPAIALFSSGLGTLAHLTVTKFKIPAYMGSSFAYIGTMQYLLKHDGIAAVAQGAITGGLVYLIVALIVRSAGRDWIDRILPPYVVGPITMVIGLSLAGSAVNDAMNLNGEYSIYALAISLVTLAAVIIYNMFGKGFVGIIPILLGIFTGYIFALILGGITGQNFVDFAKVSSAHWFQIPSFDIIFKDYAFKLYPSAILMMAPIALVTMTEHFGHLMVLNSVTGRDFFKEPGLDKTLAGDGIAQIIAGIFGAPPVTSYGENIGVMALTKIHSVFVIAGAAVFAVILSFVGKITGLIQSIPTPVLGGVSIALFGVIAASGLKILVENKVNFDSKRNLLTASVIMVAGIGNLTLNIGQFAFTGVAFATALGIIMNLVLPNDDTEEVVPVEAQNDL